MSTGWIVVIVLTVVLAAALVALYFLGKRAEKKRAEQDEQMAATAQTVSMLIIDKKKLRLKDSGLPEAVIAQTPFYAKRAKLPIVKAKIGPRIMTLICDAEIFDEIPIKREVKATRQRPLHYQGSRSSWKDDGTAGPQEGRSGMADPQAERYAGTEFQINFEQQNSERRKKGYSKEAQNRLPEYPFFMYSGSP